MGPDRRIGTELGGYRIIEPLGQGATSVVYLAEHVRLGRAAALKLLAPALGEADFRERFLRESQLAASLDHPNIVPVYDAGEVDGLLYIAMASVEGRDLKTLLAEEGPLPLRRALRIVGQVGSALDAAHGRGLVHRDVKPANVLVAADDRTYLSDFGVVKDLASNGTTRTGGFVGTIEYSAPEQIEGREVDARTDVYALACVLYESLTGTPPFHRSSEVAVLNAHLHAAPPKLTRALPEIPVAVESVIAKALSKSPLDRYGSCGEFVTALRTAAADPRVHRLRLALSLTLLVLAALLGAGIALGVHALVTNGGSGSRTRETTPVKAQPVSLDRLLLKSEDARTLNDAGFALVQAHQYARALPFLQKAVRNAPVGSLTRGYATFNLGYTLLNLGRCQASLTSLQRALQIEAKSARKYIRPQIKRAKLCVQRGASSTAP
jgi:serine/threonine protein kinase